MPRLSLLTLALALASTLLAASTGSALPASAALVASFKVQTSGSCSVGNRGENLFLAPDGRCTEIPNLQVYVKVNCATKKIQVHGSGNPNCVGVPIETRSFGCKAGGNIPFTSFSCSNRNDVAHVTTYTNAGCATPRDSVFVGTSGCKDAGGTPAATAYSVRVDRYSPNPNPGGLGNVYRHIYYSSLANCKSNVGPTKSALLDPETCSDVWPAWGSSMRYEKVAIPPVTKSPTAAG